MPAILNMHSVKNRFLMRVKIKNMTGDLYRRYWLQATARDLLVIGGCQLCEPPSLPAFWYIAIPCPGAFQGRNAAGVCVDPRNHSQ